MEVNFPRESILIKIKREESKIISEEKDLLTEAD